MELPDRLKELFSLLDTVPFQQIDARDVMHLIHQKVAGDTALSPSEEAELHAFRFREPRRSKSTRHKRYFAPLYSGHGEDPNTEEFPSLSMLSKEVMDYWSHRAVTTRHPVLAARYAGLVVDLSSRITGKRPDYKLQLYYIEKLLETIEIALYKVPIYATDTLARAFSLSVLLNNKQLLTRCKKVVFQLEKDIGEDEQPGCWTFLYEMLLEGKKKLVTIEEENEIINRLENRLTRVSGKYLRSTECAVKLLAQYYHRKKARESTRRVLNVLMRTFECTIPADQLFQLVHALESMCVLYQQYHFSKEADDLLVRIAGLAKGYPDQMATIPVEFSVSREAIDSVINEVLRYSTGVDPLKEIISVLVPDMDYYRRHLAQAARERPSVLQLMTTRLYDKRGRVVATLKPYEQDLEEHLKLQVFRELQMTAFFPAYLYAEARNREYFTVDTIRGFLSKGALFLPERLDFLENGLKAFFANDFVTAAHLIVPQLEAAIRQLVESTGNNVLHEKDGAYLVKTLGTLLDEPIVTEKFGAGVVLYFKIVLTEAVGWNIRNKIAHGMVDPIECNQALLDRVVHVMLLMGCVRLKPEEA